MIHWLLVLLLVPLYCQARDSGNVRRATSRPDVAFRVLKYSGKDAHDNVVQAVLDGGHFIAVTDNASYHEIRLPQL